MRILETIHSHCHSLPPETVRAFVGEYKCLFTLVLVILFVLPNLAMISSFQLIVNIAIITSPENDANVLKNRAHLVNGHFTAIASTSIIEGISFSYCLSLCRSILKQGNAECDCPAATELL